MNIRKLKIENYRSLKDLSIDEFGDTTIFYGENNAGKSNILNALHLIFMRKPKLTSGLEVSQLENFYEGVIKDSQNIYFNNDISIPVKFSIELEILKSELNIDPSIGSLFNIKNIFLTFEGTISYLGNGEHDFSDFKIHSIRRGGIVLYSNNEDVSYFPTLDKEKANQSEFSKAFTQLIEIFNDCVYNVSSARDMHETTMESVDERNISPKTFKKYLYSLYLSTKYFKLFEQINLVYSQPPFNFGTISFSNDGGKLEIMIKENDFRLPIKYLGSGALQALYIISSIVCSKSKIVCLEELEQNLSPRKQFEILKKIQSMINDPGLSLDQLIISSHSSVYAKPKLGIIYFLEKVDGKTIINKKEIKKISKKMLEHLATGQGDWSSDDFEEMKKYLKEHHDF